jgi:hypothetical protein
LKGQTILIYNRNLIQQVSKAQVLERAIALEKISKGLQNISSEPHQHKEFRLTWARFYELVDKLFEDAKPDE